MAGKQGKYLTYREGLIEWTSEVFADVFACYEGSINCFGSDKKYFRYLVQLDGEF